MIREIAERLTFPKEAIEVMGEVYDIVTSNEEGNDTLALAMDAFFGNKEYDPLLDQLTEMAGCHRYTMDMMFLLVCSDALHDIFYIREISDEIFWDTMMDLKYKLMECKNLYDIWGTMTIGWLQGYFFCERFKLGRLQYDIKEFQYDDYKGVLKKGDPVWTCHIPSCGPLLIEDVMESFKMAYEFYKDELKDGILPIVCLSWLVYTPHYNIYPPTSNLRKFYELFDIIGSVENKNGNIWRIFNIEEPDDYSTLPENTCLQRCMKQFLMDGNVMGEGYGVALFDGEKIINR